MAEERIQLTIGGKYNAKDAFNQWDSDIKNAQKRTKDMSQAAIGSFNQIANSVDGNLGTALKGVGSTISTLARGGVWGLIATAATTAIGFAVQKFKEAKEAAETFISILKDKTVSAIETVGKAFKGTSDEIANTRKEAKEIMSVLNGEVANNAQLKIHELHISTLQKITDDMSKVSKGVILANEAYEATLIKG